MGLAIVRLAVALRLAALALLCAACRPEVACGGGAAPCGGDAAKQWTVVNGCRDPIATEPVPPTYLAQPTTPKRQPLPEPTTTDWCSSLVYGTTGVTSFQFPYDTLSIASGSFAYAADGTYQAHLTTHGPGSIDLSAACRTRFGGSYSCDMIAAALADYVAMKPPDPGTHCTDAQNESRACEHFKSYDGIQCADDGAGGCQCSYQVTFAGVFTGTWSASGGILTHFDASGLLPSQADYCVDAAGDAMTLWGRDGASLLDLPGVRRLDLQQM
jgi:hypothetical protein